MAKVGGTRDAGHEPGTDPRWLRQKQDQTWSAIMTTKPGSAYSAKAAESAAAAATAMASRRFQAGRRGADTGREVSTMVRMPWLTRWRPPGRGSARSAIRAPEG